MTIGELSSRTGVRQSAIRYYESVGLMRRPGRVSGRRVYDPSAVTQVNVIGEARLLGFTIREIRTLVEAGQASATLSDRWQILAARKLPELAALIDRATRMKKMLEAGQSCGCVRLEDCILNACKPTIPLSAVVRSARPQ